MGSMGVGTGFAGAANLPDTGEAPALTPAQLAQVLTYLQSQGFYPNRKPVTDYGNPKFTAGRPVGVHSDGYIPRSLIQTSDLTSLLSGTYSPTVHVHSGADITSGTVADARIDAAIARDAEVAAAYFPLSSYVAATSWTPELRVNASATGITYSANRIGRYSRLGSNLIVHFDFTLTNKGASVGNAEIYGLPVAVSAVGAVGTIYFETLTTAHIGIIGRAAGSIIELWGRVSAGTSVARVTGAHLANTTRLAGTIVYNV